MDSAAPDLEVERRLLQAAPGGIVIAIDEVGRGALAGPVSLAAVALDVTSSTAPEGVRDSKALSARRRQSLVTAIDSWVRASSVVDIPANRIDEVGIMRALGEGAVAVARAVQAACDATPAIVLLDGNHDFLRPVDDSWDVHTVVKGDATCASIAAASIIAKVHRDALMSQLHECFPHYGWDRNVGYGTAEHKRALERFGISEHHRRSWRLFEHRA